MIFCADTTVNEDPDSERLTEVTRHTAALARQFNVEPRAALLSYSNFGSVETDGVQTVNEATARLRADPTADFPVGGEM